MRNQRKNDGGRDRSGRRQSSRRNKPAQGRNPSGSSLPNQKQQPPHGQSRGHHQGRSKPSSDRATNSHGQSGLTESPIRLNAKMQSMLKGHDKAPGSAPTRTYKVVFYENVAGAKNDLARLKDLAQSCDQLNIVIRSDANAETTMEDPELVTFGKVFAGAAWALIHERRVSEGWYERAH